MSVRRPPFRLVPVSEVAETSNLLGDLSEKSANDMSVRGSIVIMDRGRKGLDMYCSGRVARVDSLAAFFLMKMVLWYLGRK